MTCRPEAGKPVLVMVITAAEIQNMIRADNSKSDLDYLRACEITDAATQARLRAEAPPDPVRELRTAWDLCDDGDPRSIARLEAAIVAIEKRYGK